MCKSVNKENLLKEQLGEREVRPRSNCNCVIMSVMSKGANCCLTFAVIRSNLPQEATFCEDSCRHRSCSVAFVRVDQMETYYKAPTIGL